MIKLVKVMPSAMMGSRVTGSSWCVVNGVVLYQPWDSSSWQHFWGDAISLAVTRRAHNCVDLEPRSIMVRRELVQKQVDIEILFTTAYYGGIRPGDAWAYARNEDGTWRAYCRNAERGWWAVDGESSVDNDAYMEKRLGNDSVLFGKFKIWVRK